MIDGDEVAKAAGQAPCRYDRLGLDNAPGRNRKRLVTPALGFWQQGNERLFDRRRIGVLLECGR